MSDRGFAVMTGDMEIAAMNLHLKEWRSNARLIAAAPDLLAALNRLLDEPFMEHDIDGRKMAAAAIAKATGE